MKKLFLVFICSATAGLSNIYGQTPEQEQVISDLLNYADMFSSPAANSASYQATSGWFTSAASLNKWEVDISFHANALFVPKSKREVSVSNRDFSTFNLIGDDRAVLPTAFGKETDAQFEGSVSGEDFTFDAIDGIDKEFLFYPFPQVTVGLPYGTEFAIRALPNMTIEDTDFSTYGAALKHNLTQWFGFNPQPDDLQVAAIVSYNMFDLKYNKFDPIVVNSPVGDLINLRQIDVSANIWMVEAMASKRYENFEIFGALGATASSFDYEFGGSGILLGYSNQRIQEIAGNETQFKGDIGFNLYFNKFKISTMATAGNFFNVNMGLHFRI